MREIIIGANPQRGSIIPCVVMNNDGILFPIDPRHPNAKLIAAAPELLGALKAILDDVRELLEKNDSLKVGTMGVVHIARAQLAIKKATE